MNQIELDEKQQCLECISKFLHNFEKKLHANYEQKKISEKIMEMQDICYFKLKEIVMYKESTQTLDKIYYSIPLPILKLASRLNKATPVVADSALDIASKNRANGALTINVDQSGNLKN